MRFLITISLILVCSLNSIAQFGYAYGNAGYNYGASACTTKFDTGFFLLGSSSWFSNGNLDYYLLKTDSAGKVKWAKNYGSTAIEKATDIINIGDSVFYLSGISNELNNGDYNLKLVKINKHGDVLFDKQLGTVEWDFSGKTTIATDTSLLIAGQTYFAPNHNGDGYIVKVNLLGDTVKTTLFGDTTEENFNYIDCKSNNITVSGYKKTKQGIKQALVVKYDINLSPLDTFVFNHNYDCEFYTAKYLKNKNTYALGYIKSSANSAFHLFRCLLDTNYNLIWVDSTSFASDEYIKDFVEQENGEVMMIGATKRYGNGNYGFYDLNLILLNSDLLFNSSKTYGGVYEDTPSQVISINDSTYAAIGSTNNFGPAYSHVFFIKFNTKNYTINTEAFLIGKSESVNNQIIIYPNPANNRFILKNLNEKANYTIYNISGQIFKKGEIDTNNPLIDLEEISAGYYIFELNLQHKTSRYSFIRE